MRLNRHKCQLLVVDLQEKVLPQVRRPKRVARVCTTLIRAARRLDVPITLTEHYPQGLGRTIAEIRDEAGEKATILAKIHFSCLGEDILREHLLGLRRQGRSQIVVAGVETHICVGQTVLDLQDYGFDTFVAADGVSSRSGSSRKLALARCRQAGVRILDSEMVLFEWLERAETPEFKELIELIK